MIWFISISQCLIVKHQTLRNQYKSGHYLKIIHVIWGADKFLTEPVSSKRYKFACAPIKDSDQPVQLQADQSLQMGIL